MVAPPSRASGTPWAPGNIWKAQSVGEGPSVVLKRCCCSNILEVEKMEKHKFVAYCLVTDSVFFPHPL